MAIQLPPPQDFRGTDNYYEGNSGQVYLACLHESVGMLDRYDLAQFCESAGVSYNAIADNDGLLYTVDRDNSAWHLRDANGRADGLCLTTPTRGYSRAEWLGEQWNKVEIAAWWLEAVTRGRGIDLAHCTHRNIRDALRGDQAAGGVIGHVDYTLATGDGSHTDPRDFPFDVCIETARQIRAALTEEEDMPLSDDDIAKIWAYPVANWPRNTNNNPATMPVWRHVHQARGNAELGYQRTFALQATIDKLADLLADQNQLDTDTITAAVRQAIEDSVVDVDVTVADRTEGDAPKA